MVPTILKRYFCESCAPVFRRQNWHGAELQISAGSVICGSRAVGKSLFMDRNWRCAKSATRLFANAYTMTITESTIRR